MKTDSRFQVGISTYILKTLRQKNAKEASVPVARGPTKGGCDQLLTTLSGASYA